MYIKSITIDGFKSYGQRTEINGFDPEFNAITGLNGSGKSNILDAICFLLGITNLSHVRATNLQELVYKNGQAGITKATVSITFDNSDKKNSPQGFEHHDEIIVTRQVVVGNKNKYLINGKNIQNNRVQDFFRSVQLNVNNPHFLIMQGRITKVLNMKPPEILAMIEEAVGTMMYETKKFVAQKTIEKKDHRLREIKSLLDEEITPSIQKLKAERDDYLEYQKVQRELEHLTKLYVAYNFMAAEKAAKKLGNDFEEVNATLDSIQEEIKKETRRLEQIYQSVAVLQKKRDEELGGRRKELEGQLKEKEMASLKAESNLKSIKDSRKQEEKKKDQIKRSLKTDETALEEKNRLANGVQDLYDQLRHEHEKCEDAMKLAQRRFEAISVGKFLTEDCEGGEGSAATFQQQAIKIKDEIIAAQTKIKTCNLAMEHNHNALAKLNTDMKKTEQEFKKDNDNLKRYENEVDRIFKEMAKLNYEDGCFESLEEEYRTLRTELNATKHQVDAMYSKYPWLDFQFTDPEPNFNRALVKGVAARLFTVKDPKFCVALDTAGGGKLSNVIVKTADAAAKILQKGRLARRTVLLPLDKMQSNPISPQMAQIAEKLVGRGNVVRALDLIEYEPSLEPAMNYIFGGVFVCKDLDTANKVAFNPQTSRLCVTIDGDKVNPSGELSGGAPVKSGSLLTHVNACKEAVQTMEDKKQKLKRAEIRLKELEATAKRFNSLKHQHELKTHELQLVRDRMKGTTHHRLKEETADLEKQIEQLQTDMDSAKKTEQEGTKKLADIQYKMEHAKELKEKELKASEAEVKKCKKALEVAKSRWSEKEAEEAALKLEISQLQKSIEEYEEQLKLTSHAISDYETQIVQANDALKDCRQSVKEAEEMLKIHKDLLSSNNKEIDALNESADKIIKGNQQKELEIQQLKHKVEKANDECREARKTVEAMLAKYEWIAEDRKFFGQPNTSYDFKSVDPKEQSKRINKLEETKDKLGKSVNMRAMTLLGQVEEKYRDLIVKKTTVENDKIKIQQVIKELDIKKKEELRSAWEKVNKDFGSIFSTLLPGASAKLVPPDGKDVLEGLEVRVAFGGQWKESLSELSGGQRSLVALSLILALLLYKPAPLYILDEVDAALDLSHTQNIGHMLKTHFKHSQFIVVSLKDGMFNNANVLFKTKFVDGMSTVSRSAQR